MRCTGGWSSDLAGLWSVDQPAFGDVDGESVDGSKDRILPAAPFVGVENDAEELAAWTGDDLGADLAAGAGVAIGDLVAAQEAGTGAGDKAEATRRTDDDGRFPELLSMFIAPCGVGAGCWVLWCS